MNIIHVARKDLRRVFRGPFALIMMFGAPLLIAGLLYFAFGGLADSSGGFHLTRTHVIIANLDQPPQASQFKAGDMLVQFLQNEDLQDVLELSMAVDETSARSAVDHQEANVALIVPADFTEATPIPDQTAAVILYQDPTLTIGPGIVKDPVNHFMDGFSRTCSRLGMNRMTSAGSTSTAQRNPIRGLTSPGRWTSRSKRCSSTSVRSIRPKLANG